MNNVISSESNALERIEQSGVDIEYIYEARQADKDVVLAAVAQNGMALACASEALRANQDVVLAAVAQNGFAIIYASEALRANKDVVLAAVVQNGFALAYASKALQANQDVVLAAVAQNGFALTYASKALQANKEFILRAVAQNVTVLAHASEALRANKEFILSAVAQNGMALAYASEALRANKEFILSAVAQKGMALACASEALRANQDVVLRAVAQNGTALAYASEALKYDISFFWHVWNIQSAESYDYRKMYVTDFPIYVTDFPIFELILTLGLIGMVLVSFLLSSLITLPFPAIASLIIGGCLTITATLFTITHWNLESVKSYDYRETYVTNFLTIEALKVTLGLIGMALGGLLLSGVMTFLIPTIASLIIGGCLTSAATLYTSNRLYQHGLGYFETKNIDATRQNPAMAPNI